MPRPKIDNPKKIIKSLRVTNQENDYIKEISIKFSISEQAIFEEGYKLFIKQLIERG